MKVLMIHPIETSKGEWERSLVRNFLHLGDEIISIDYRKIFKKRKVNSILKKLNIYQYFLLNKIKKTIQTFNPDVIFVSKGELLTPKMLKEIKSFNIPMINWIGDGMWEFELIKNIASFYDMFYTFDNETVKELNKININNSKYLTFGFDTLIDRDFKPDEIEYYKSDIAFVGTPTSERMVLLKYLENTNYNIKIWGPKKWEKTPYSKYYMGKPIFGKEMSFAYSQAKIVINVHYGFNQDNVPYYSGINNRIFEAFGNGTYCLSNYQKDMEITFENKLITYKNFDELVDKIEEVMNNNNLVKIQNEILEKYNIINLLNEIKSDIRNIKLEKYERS